MCVFLVNLFFIRENKLGFFYLNGFGIFDRYDKSVYWL